MKFKKVLNESNYMRLAKPTTLYPENIYWYAIAIKQDKDEIKRNKIAIQLQTADISIVDEVLKEIIPFDYDRLRILGSTNNLNNLKDEGFKLLNLTEELDESKTYEYPQWVYDTALKYFNDGVSKCNIENVSIKQLVDDNDLLNDEELQSYHQRSWNNSEAKDFHINQDIVNKYDRLSQVPFAYKKKDGKIELGDGKHRTRALYNDGYDYVKLPVIVSESLLNENKSWDVIWTDDCESFKNKLQAIKRAKEIYEKGLDKEVFIIHANDRDSDGYYANGEILYIKDLYESLNENLIKKQELKKSTAYMLRNDGKLFECKSYHPYIVERGKNNLIRKTKNKEFLINYLFDDVQGYEDLKWFYNNTNQQEIKNKIQQIIQSLIQLNYFKNNELWVTEEEVIKDFNIDNSIFYTDKMEDIYSNIELLNNLTNQEFCRIRTSNMFLGGSSNDIYFRISSIGFNWFNLIWDIINNYNIDTITIVKDYIGQDKEEFYKIKGQIIDHISKEDFLNLSGNPIIENLDKNWQEEINKINENYINKLVNNRHSEHINNYFNWYRNSGMLQEDLNNLLNEVYPNKGESKKDFTKRFMKVTKDEYPDVKQRYAVCMSYWSRRNKKRKKNENLNEKLLKGAGLDIFYTDSAYEAKNYLMNNNKEYRCFVSNNEDIYLFGDAYNCIHRQIFSLAKAEGYLDNNIASNDFYDEGIAFIYVPNHPASKDNKTFLYFRTQEDIDMFKTFELYKLLNKNIKIDLKIWSW